MTGIGKRVLKGSFTIEATLLMMLILPLMIALIITGFYIHDRGRFQAAACETAARASCLVIDSRQEEIIGKTAQNLKAGSMWTQNAYGRADVSENHVLASFGGDFSFPGFGAMYLSGSRFSCEGSWERTIYHPASLIRKVRGVKALVDTISQ